MADILYEYKGSIFCINEWGWNRNHTTYTITGFRSVADDLWIPPDYAGSLITPEVKLVPENFYNNPNKFHYNVKRLHIPAFVQRIQTNNCVFPNLIEILVDPQNKYYQAMGSMLIRKGTLEYVFNAGMMRSCTIPKEIQKIGDYAFQNSLCLEIIFENPDVTLEKYAFQDSMWMNQKVPLLLAGNTLYRSYTPEPSLTIPDNVKAFDSSAFSMTSLNLREIITPRPLPLSCISSLSKQLHRYILLKTPNKINLTTIRSCEALEYFELRSSSNKYCTVNGVLFSADMKKLLFYPAGKPDKFYHIPDGVESIHTSAFQNCTCLEEIIMPDSVRKLGQASFYNCKKLKTIRFSNNITDIPGTSDFVKEGVFENCKALGNNIQFPPKLRHIGSYAFFGCDLSEINIPDFVEYIGEYAFASYTMDLNYGLNSMLKHCTLPPSVIQIGRGAIAGTKHVTATEGTARGLICAIEAIPPSNKINTIYNNMLWLGSDITMNRINGSIEYIDIPQNLNTESRMHIDMAWNQPEFDFDEYEECFEGITNTEEKQLFALDLYHRQGDKCFCADYLRRVAAKLAETLIQNRAETRLIELLKYRFLTDNALRKLLKLTNEAEMATASAYIMQALSNKKKSSSLKL